MTTFSKKVVSKRRMVENRVFLSFISLLFFVALTFALGLGLPLREYVFTLCAAQLSALMIPRFIEDNPEIVRRLSE